MHDLLNALRIGLDASLPWERARETTMPEFLERHTLHDAEWLQLDVAPGVGAILVFEWPAISARDLFGPLTDWPLLVVGLDDLYRVMLPQHDGCVRTVRTASSDELSASVRDELLNLDSTRGKLADAATAPPLHRTVIQSVAGGAVELTHGTTARVLCLDSSGAPVDLPWSDKTT